VCLIPGQTQQKRPQNEPDPAGAQKDFCRRSTKAEEIEKEGPSDAETGCADHIHIHIADIHMYVRLYVHNRRRLLTRGVQSLCLR
jgi:hypothetical protein